MRLEDLVKPIDQMSDAELQEMLKQIRHNRKVLRPAKQKHAERAEKKETRKKTNKIEDLVKGMTPEARAALVAQLKLQLGG